MCTMLKDILLLGDEELDRILLYDAVLNTAAPWNHVWKTVSKE